MPDALNLAFIDAIGKSFWVVIGIGLVIFVHELGHYLCARWCDVRVEIFSLGFGPRLFGFVRDGTDYRVSAVPFGGYVKMAGDQPGEGVGAGDELSEKTTGQRFLVYSGGVIMNVVFAVVVFPLIFWIGVPLLRPAVGPVAAGGPAWKAGLQEGDEILAVNDREVLGFTDIALEVALGDPDATTVRIDRAGREMVVPVTPKYDENTGAFVIGIGSPSRYELEVEPGGAAEVAGLRTGDRLVAVDGFAMLGGGGLAALDGPAGVPVTFTVERDGARLDLAVERGRVENAERKVIGIQTPIHLVASLRGEFAGGGAPLRVGDRLLTVDGRYVGEPNDLRRAARARAEGAAATLTVERDGATREVTLDPPLAEALDRDVALRHELPDSPRGPVPVVVTDGSPAARAGMVTGMRVVAVDGVGVEDWGPLSEAIRAADGAQLELSVVGETGPRTITVAAAPMADPDFGLGFRSDEVVRRFAPVAAFTNGLRASWNFTRHAYLVLRKMAARQLSVRKNLGGPVAISRVSYHFAESGLAKLFYFLALLSINLAVINLLPIPVLDGGHLLFILIEKVKGSPVDDRVLGYSQVFGFVVILSLLVFVTYNDILRLLE